MSACASLVPGVCVRRIGVGVCEIERVAVLH
jgi:hypothetical protein